MSAVEVAPRDSAVRSEQPYLHELVTVVAAPALVLSEPDGQLTAPASGVYLADHRVLSRLVVTVDGHEPAPVRGQSTDTATARFVGVARHLGDEGPDPTVFVERDRTVSPHGARETISLVSRATEPLTCTVTVELDSDLAAMDDIKAGRPSTAPPIRPEVGEPGTVRWPVGGDITVIATLAPAPDEVRVGAPSRVLAGWDVTLAARGRWSVTLEVTATAPGRPPIAAPPTRELWRPPTVTAGDHRFPALLDRAVADLAGLLAADPDAPEDHYLTAGAPWYLTLFGRDSIWAARMALPLGTELAAGTLRTLARRQGTRRDPDTEEEPGKILHEVRTGPGGIDLYFGTVDATPLWISLLHDAWRWGLPAADVEALLPNLEAALGWLRASAGTGFVKYADSGGRLANQGWKDSGNSVQYADGRLAPPPIALCEVQSYSYEAARQGADLLDAFGRDGGAGWRDWAGALRDRFRDRFWVEDPAGRYPAIALDGDGRPVDSITSNIGHLLGSGLLAEDETAAVVARLAAPDLDCGVGLRTMSSRSAGFNPLSYHGGSVWAHDTAIALRGLAATGTEAARATAASYVHGLLAAGAAFDFRLPELYGGETAGGGRLPLAYPAACRPQAWSAAAALVVLTATLGLEPDVPAGRVTLRPLRPSPVGELTVRGLRIAGEPLDLHLSADGTVEILAAPAGVEITLP
ncbi:MAG TPA: glycogen debranching N-terminal domain-containing protein [Mycobacteriales bacterium]|nr:glycogen debranching N-terminal domain-containing protein [Mycobacteriales bacterium]